MCEKCWELDKQIEKYQRLCRSATDMPTVERLQAQVRELIGKKLDLHTRPASSSE
jgi:hypothetical protein